MGVGPARFPHPCVCKICDKEVVYRERKRCHKCGDWIHNYCGNVDSRHPEKRTLCFECLPPCSNMELIDSLMQDLDTDWEPESYKSGAIFLASLHCGPDEQKIVELTGYLPDEVRVRGDRLRENKLWFDGKVGIPEPVPEGDGRTATMALLMAILCADGIIQRSDVEEMAGSKSTVR